MKKIIFGKKNSSEQIVICRPNDDESLFDMNNSLYIEMKAERPHGNWHAKMDGYWHSGDPIVECEWISCEIDMVKNQLLLHEDDDPLAIATEADWREYRRQLRRWNWDHEYFPNPEYRPVRPK